jgi:uncharacterized protein (TIGR00369 family)
LSDSEQIIDRLNSHREQFLEDMGCVIRDVDVAQRSCTMEFNINQSYCHSGDIIQGGFVTAMLDATATHAVFLANHKTKVVATLELKVTFYEVSRMGKLTAIGKVDKMTRSIAFVSADLFDTNGVLTASLSSTAKIVLAD